MHFFNKIEVIKIKLIIKIKSYKENALSKKKCGNKSKCF